MLKVWAHFLPLLLCEAVALYVAWEVFRERGGRFTYGITDIWTLALGLTPSFLLAAHTVHMIELRVTLYWPAQHMAVLLAVLVVSQLAGVVCARLCYQPGPRRARLEALMSATSVVAGAAGGFVVLVFYVLVLKLLGWPF